jgi:hypothetical protein
MVSRNSRFKAKELLLLLLPTIGLAAMGFALRHQESTGKPPRDTSGPTQLIVTGIKREPVTPRDVAQGFDTRFAVTLDYKGATPAAWGEDMGWSLGTPLLSVKKAGKRVYLGEETGWRRVRFDNGKGVYISSFLLPLSHVNSRTGEIFFEAEIGVRPQTAGGTRNPGLPAIPIAFKARNANQTTQIPKVSRYRPFALGKVTTTHYGSGATAGAMVKVILHLHEAITADAEPRLETSGQTYVLDETKKRYWVTSYAWSVDAQKKTCQVRFDLDGKNLPASAQHLTLKAQLSVDDCWPLPISVVVRNTRKP